MVGTDSFRGHRGGPHHHDGEPQPDNHDHTDIVPKEKDEKKKNEPTDMGWNRDWNNWGEQVTG